MSQKLRAYVKDSKYGLAIVTGGSSGIGKSIIEQVETLDLALLVFNLSRRKPPTFTIDQRHLHLECDLADRQQRSQVFTTLEAKVEQQSEDGPILLVNNAGFGAYGDVDSISVRQHLDLIEVNVLALVELTTRLLPFLKQRGGAIMNIASTAAFQPVPLMASYAASKSFVLNWTLALNEELRGSPARALAICPGPTRTRFFENAGVTGTPGGHSQAPEAVAKAALAALERKPALLVTGMLNKTMTSLAGLAPRALAARLAGQVIRRFRNNAPENS